MGNKNELFKAILYNDNKKIKSLIQEYPIDIKDEQGNTLLHLAVRFKNEILLKAIEKGIKDLASIENYLGQTPLHLAAMHNVGLMRKLWPFIDHKVINSQDNDGLTCLHMAAASGEKETVEFLLDNGADLKIKNNKGQTAIDLAKSFAHTDIYKFLRQSHQVELSSNYNAQEERLQKIEAELAEIKKHEEELYNKFKAKLRVFKQEQRNNIEQFLAERKNTEKELLHEIQQSQQYILSRLHEEQESYELLILELLNQKGTTEEKLAKCSLPEQFEVIQELKQKVFEHLKATYKSDFEELSSKIQKQQRDIEERLHKEIEEVQKKQGPLLAEHERKSQIEHEQYEILNNPNQKAFYNAIQARLGSKLLADLTLNSGKIKLEDNMLTKGGRLAGSVVGSCIPTLGVNAVVGFFIEEGASQVRDHFEYKKVDNTVHSLTTLKTAMKIAELTARRLTQNPELSDLLNHISEHKSEVLGKKIAKHAYKCISAGIFIKENVSMTDMVNRIVDIIIVEEHKEKGVLNKVNKAKESSKKQQNNSIEENNKTKDNKAEDEISKQAKRIKQLEEEHSKLQKEFNELKEMLKKENSSKQLLENTDIASKTHVEKLQLKKATSLPSASIKPLH
jgi:hypothetical protein